MLIDQILTELILIKIINYNFTFLINDMFLLILINFRIIK